MFHGFLNSASSLEHLVSAGALYWDFLLLPSALLLLTALLHLNLRASGAHRLDYIMPTYFVIFVCIIMPA